MIIDLVGLPGVGKTTLTNFIIDHDPQIMVKKFPYIKDVRQIPFFVKNLFVVIPNLVRTHHDWKHGWFTPRDLSSMVILSEWSRVLEKQAFEKGKTILLDEGAVELLAWLYGFGSDYLRGNCAKNWWDRTYRQWSKTINMIIYLDSPIPVLLERIRTRDNGWDKESDADIIKMFTTLRASHEQVLGILKAESDCPILRFNTLVSSTNQIGNEILNHLHRIKPTGQCFSLRKPIA